MRHGLKKMIADRDQIDDGLYQLGIAPHQREAFWHRAHVLRDYQDDLPTVFGPEEFFPPEGHGRRTVERLLRSLGLSPGDFGE
jgi:hypothetical protein